MQIPTLIRLSNISLSIFTILLSLYMFRLMYKEYRYFKELKNGRRFISLILLFSFFETIFDALTVLTFSIMGILNYKLIYANMIGASVGSLLRMFILISYIRISKKRNE